MNKIQMAAKLYECRDTAKKFYGKEYKERIEEYKLIILKVMEKTNSEEIPALIKISKTSAYQNSGITQMLFMAAVVEIIEPS
jgi:hypothetical protein